MDVNVDVANSTNQTTSAIYTILMLSPIIHGVIDGMLASALRAAPSSFNENPEQKVALVSTFESAGHNTISALGQKHSLADLSQIDERIRAINLNQLINTLLHKIRNSLIYRAVVFEVSLAQPLGLEVAAEYLEADGVLRFAFLLTLHQ